MATRITGSIRLPDGTLLNHGYVIFTPQRPAVGATIMLGGEVRAPIMAGAIDVSLEAEASGTVYSVRAEYLSPIIRQQISTSLPDIVPQGQAGPVTLESLIVHPIPAGVSNSAIWKRGDTISIGGQWLDANNRPLDLSGHQFACALYGPDAVTRTMTVVISDAARGLIEITMSAARSKDLPLGLHQIDVKISNGVRISHTRTGTISIEKEYTP